MSVTIDATHFPDADFREYVRQFDTNSDGILSDAELSAVTSMYISITNCSLTGITYFTSLKSLTAKGCLFNGISLSGLTLLEQLSIDNDQGSTYIELNNMPNLKSVTIDRTRLKTIRFILLPKLLTVSVEWATNIQTETDATIFFEDVPLLNWLRIFGNSTGYLARLTGLESLTELTSLFINNGSWNGNAGASYHDKSLQNIDISALKKLTSIDLNGSSIVSVDASNLTNLLTLKCEHMPRLKILKTINCSKLTDLKLGDVSLETLDISNCISLTTPSSSLYWYYTANFKAQGCTALEQYLAFNADATQGSTKPILYSVNLAGCTNLKKLQVAFARHLNTFNLDGCFALEDVDISGYIFSETLDASQWKSLKKLACHNGIIKNLILGEHPQLNYLSCYTYLPGYAQSTGGIASLHIEKCPKLIDVYNNGEKSNTYFAPQWNYNDYSFQTNNTHLIADTATEIYDGTVRITSQPTNVSVDEGHNAQFSVVASGTDIRYQWLSLSPSSNTWVVLNGANSATYNAAGTANNDGAKYKCQVSSENDTVISEPAILTVLTAPIVTTNPTDLTLKDGAVGTFAVAANGHENVYQWQTSVDGNIWENIRNANGETYAIKATLSMDGYEYRCKISNSVGTTYSNSAVLTVEEDLSIIPPQITTQPSSTTITEGETAKFELTATGFSVNYQWQNYRNNKWYNISGEITNKYQLIGNLSMTGSRYRCQVSNPSGSVYSSIVSLTVEPDTSIVAPTIISNPMSVSVTNGATATFRVEASGGALSYQWQKFNLDWENIIGATSNIYRFTAFSSANGSQYRCVVSNSSGVVYSSAATLIISMTQDMVLTINGVEFINSVDSSKSLVAYGGFKWQRNDVESPSAGRDLSGLMHRGRVSTKIRLDITCKPLTAEEAQLVLNTIYPEFVTVTYTDPQEGLVTKTMYSNNNPATFLLNKRGREYWGGITFPLIEQ